jgi:heterodisulfide reductase subunit D
MTVAPQRLTRLVHLGLKDEALDPLSFWLCTSCNACNASCPRGLPILETVIGLKQYAIAHRLDVPEELQVLRNTIVNQHNISGDPNEDRLLWNANLPRSLPLVEGEKDAGVLYFVGCVSSLYPRAYSIPQAFARTLARAGIRFTVLGREEWCCGFPLYNAGLKKEMVSLVAHNVERVRALGVSTLVTTCPSCYYAWKVLYPKFQSLPEGLSIVHASQVLAELLDSGRIRPSSVPRTVTYHDPCDLGRKSGEYEAPRHVLRSLPGLELREMANVKANALCCGGGGDVKIYSNDTTMEVSRRRVQQAFDVDAGTIVSSCQQCKRALVSAVQWMRHPMKVIDLAELVWESLPEDDG